mgnify:FL=1
MLSVVIVNWNTRDLLDLCLGSIQEHSPKIPFEVIVVDNGSGDGSAAMVEQKHPWAKLLSFTENLGYAEGNNRGLGVATGEWILLLNPDTEFMDASLDHSVRWMNEHPGVGAVGAQLIGFDGQIQESVRGFPTLVGIFGNWTRLDRVWPNGPLGRYRVPRFDYQKTQECDQPMGTFLLFRRSSLEELGPLEKAFDSDFPIFFNEVDLLKRLNERGWIIMYEPSIKIRHLGGAGTRQVRKNMIWESHRSLVRYFRKHLRGPQRLLLPLVTALAWTGAFIRARGYHAGFRT